MRLISLIVAALLAVAPARAQLTTTGAGGNGQGGGGGFQGVGDVQTTQAAGYWGMRCYKASQASATQVINIRGTDGTTTDIGFTSSCNLDVSTASSFCTTHGTPCTIVTWYDISGSTNCSSAKCNFTQATVAKQAQLVFNCLNTSLPCALFTASSLQFYTVACVGVCSNAANSWSYVAERNGNFSSNVFIFSGQSGGSVTARTGWSSSGNQAILNNSGATSTIAASDSNFHTFLSLFNSQGLGLPSVTNDGVICADNSCGAKFTGGTLAFGSPLNFGSSGTGGSDFMQGYVAEIGWWIGQSMWTTTTMQLVCHNQFTYWATAVSC
jgi:hypothetical protein